MTIPWVIQELRAERATGTAVFSRESEVKKIFFRDGEIISTSSTDDADGIGTCLLRSGKISREQHDAASEIAAKRGTHRDAVLLEQGFVTHLDFIDCSTSQTWQIVLSLFKWRDGRYAFDSGPLPPSDIVLPPTAAGQLLQEGIRGLDWKDIRKALPPIKTVLHPAENLSLLRRGIDLDHDQTAALSLIDGSKNIEELCALSPLGDFNTLKSIFALLALRLVETGASKTKAEVRQSTDHAAVSAWEERESRLAEAASSPELARQMIEQAYNSRETQNYYELLGVEKNAAPQEIRKAYVLLAKLYHPDRHIHSGLQDIKSKLETLFAGINEAYNTLTDGGKRNEYDRDLTRGVKHVRKEEPAPASKEDTKKNIAVTQFNEGLKQFRAQNFWGAEESFQWAVRMEPENADYVFYLGLALSRMPRRGHDAEEYLIKAVDLNPSKIEYHLELGNFYVRSGLKAKALSAYQKALQHHPNADKIKQAMKGVEG